jgi:hypothetical protein
MHDSPGDHSESRGQMEFHPRWSDQAAENEGFTYSATDRGSTRLPAPSSSVRLQLCSPLVHLLLRSFSSSHDSPILLRSPSSSSRDLTSITPAPPTTQPPPMAEARHLAASLPPPPSEASIADGGHRCCRSDFTTLPPALLQEQLVVVLSLERAYVARVLAME